MIRFLTGLFLLFSMSYIFGENRKWPFGTIKTFGDSHSCFSFGKMYPQDHEIVHKFEKNGDNFDVTFQTHHIGSRLMYSFANNGCDISEFESISKGQYVIFCLGNIDVGIHLQKYNHDFEAVKENIDLIVNLYLDKIAYYQSLIGFQPIVFGVLPPLNDKLKPKEGAGSGHLGTTEQRVRTAKQMNITLEKECLERGVLFFEVFEEYANCNGALRKSLTWDCTHIHFEKNAIVKNKVCNLIFEN